MGDPTQKTARKYIYLAQRTIYFVSRVGPRTITSGQSRTRSQPSRKAANSIKYGTHNLNIMPCRSIEPIHLLYALFHLSSPRQAGPRLCGETMDMGD